MAKAIFTKFPKNDNWVDGKVTLGKEYGNKEFDFQAKLFDEGSCFGINEGRVSKLAIWDQKVREEKMNFLEACIFHFDRGEDINIDEEKPGHKEAYDAVMELLENSEKRFE